MAASTSSVGPAFTRPTVPRDADWRATLADAVTEAAELCRRLDLPAGLAAAARSACRDFPLLVPGPFLARMQPQNPRDPLLLQVLPQASELGGEPGFGTDPVGECQTTVWPGMLAKYPHRLLIVASDCCAVHCRFCFRLHFPYRGVPQSTEDWTRLMGRIAGERSIQEVILSGGDPLTLDDAELAALVSRLADIPHVKRVRLHTRMPVVIPQRVTQELTEWMRGSRLTVLTVVHVNHPAEIDEQVAAALGRLVDAGVPVLSQSVLLRGVNDRVEVLAGLYDRLATLRVMPYYLHQLDRVAGAAHFEVPEREGIELVRQLRARLPGYAVPRYVRETVGEPHKRVLA